jgi:hypothetical protein
LPQRVCMGHSYGEVLRVLGKNLGGRGVGSPRDHAEESRYTRKVPGPEASMYVATYTAPGPSLS